MSTVSNSTTYNFGIQTSTGQNWGWSVTVDDGTDHDADAASIYKGMAGNPLIANVSVDKTDYHATSYTTNIDATTGDVTFS